MDTKAIAGRVAAREIAAGGKTNWPRGFVQDMKRIGFKDEGGNGIFVSSNVNVAREYDGDEDDYRDWAGKKLKKALKVLARHGMEQDEKPHYDTEYGTLSVSLDIDAVPVKEKNKVTGWHPASRSIRIFKNNNGWLHFTLMFTLKYDSNDSDFPKDDATAWVKKNWRKIAKEADSRTNWSISEAPSDFWKKVDFKDFGALSNSHFGYIGGPDGFQMSLWIREENVIGKMASEKAIAERVASSVVAGGIVEFVTKVPIDYGRLPEGYEDTPNEVAVALKRADVGGRVTKVKIHRNKPWEVWTEVRAERDNYEELEKALNKIFRGLMGALNDLASSNDWYDEYIFRDWVQRKFETEIM